MTRFLAILLFFFNFQKIHCVPSLWTFMTQANYLRLELVIHDSISRQLNGSEDNNVMSFSKIL